MPNENLPLPYVSFGIFKGTTEQFSDAILPTGPLDRRVMSWLSGADFGSLVSALRFLGLVDEEKKATESYRALVGSVKDPEVFKTALSHIISEKYYPVVGEFDIERGTAAQLEKAFKDYGVSAGQMLSKTTRFYIKALQEVGLAVSPHITKPKPRSPRVVRARLSNPSNIPTLASLHLKSVIEIPAGFERMPIPGIANAFIQYPVSLTSAQVTVIEAMVTGLRAYAQGNSPGGKGNKP